MKHVVIVSHHAGDLLKFRGYLIRDLVKTGVKVSCLAPDYVLETRGEVASLGATPVSYRLKRTGMNPFRDALDAIGLWKLLRELAPDVVFAFSTKPMLYGTLAAWCARVPRRLVLVEGAGYLFTSSGDRRDWPRRVLKTLVFVLYRLSLRRAHRVVFLNSDDMQEFVNRGFVSRRCSVLLGGIGVDLQEWKPVRRVTEPVCFLMVARLIREKGVLEYVAAARRVKSRYPRVRFCLLGKLDTNPGALSQDQVSSWVLEGVLEWPGFVPVRPWLEQASVFVLPSYREGVPLSTQEATAVGKPVITTDVPGCRETVLNGVNGFLIPPRDEVALAAAMQRFLDDPSLIQTMGLASRKLAEDRFDVRAVNARLLSWIVE